MAQLNPSLGFEIVRVNNSRAKIRAFGLPWGELRRHRGDTLWTATGRVDARGITAWGPTQESAYNSLIALVREHLETQNQRDTYYSW